MKNIGTLFFITTSFSILCICVELGCAQSSARTFEPGAVEFYDPGAWRTFPVGHWTYQPIPDSLPYNNGGLWGDLPRLGYPMRPAAFAGVNDTLQIAVVLYNKSKYEYSLKGLNPAEWFRPRVFRCEDDPVAALPWRDSTNLAWRLRYWLDLGGRPTKAPDSIKLVMSFTLYMVFDIWQLPAGIFGLFMVPTPDTPKDFVGRIAGMDYEYYEPHSQADTINAWEACYWRAWLDTNYAGANDWAKKILSINPYSVPGLWLWARYFVHIGDTFNAKSNYDSAISSLQNKSDPLMPDTSKALSSYEREYLGYCRRHLSAERGSLGP